MRMGGQKKTKNVWIFCIVAVLVVIILGYFLLRGQGPGTEPAVEGAYKMGQTIDSGGIQLNVVRSYESKGTDSERPQLQSIFTIARVALTNNTAQPLMVKPGDFVLLVDGKERPLRTLNYVFDQFIESELGSKATVEGAISWETPIKYRSKYLVYKDPSGQLITVDLMKKTE